SRESPRGFGVESDRSAGDRVDDGSIHRAQIFDQKLLARSEYSCVFPRYLRFTVVHRKVDLREYSSMRIGAAYKYAILIDDKRLHHIFCADDYQLSGYSTRPGGGSERRRRASRRLPITTMRAKHIVGTNLFTAMSAKDPFHRRRGRRWRWRRPRNGYLY